MTLQDLIAQSKARKAASAKRHQDRMRTVKQDAKVRPSSKNFY